MNDRFPQQNLFESCLEPDSGSRGGGGGGGGSDCNLQGPVNNVRDERNKLVLLFRDVVRLYNHNRRFNLGELSFNDEIKLEKNEPDQKDNYEIILQYKLSQG
jgi:hypothetical protein